MRINAVVFCLTAIAMGVAIGKAIQDHDASILITTGVVVIAVLLVIVLDLLLRILDRLSQHSAVKPE